MNTKEQTEKAEIVLSVSEMPQENISVESGRSFLLHGDSYDWLKKIPENSMDSVVCDPPYMIGFMGKEFDNPVDNVAADKDFWKLVLRVLKPGGHLLAFGGTRTYHRMASAIEDAGFEVRDMIEWVYGCLSEDTEVLTKDGFKHFHKITQDDIIRVYDTQNDIYKWEKPQRWSQYAVKQDTAYRIKSDTTDQIVSRNHNCLVEREGKLVFVKSEDLLQMERVPVLSDDISILQEGQGELLHPELLWQGEGLVETILSERVGQEASRDGIERREEPCVERGSDLQKEKGEICRPENQVCEMSDGVSNNGEKGRVCNGTQIEIGTGDTKTADKNGVCSSHQSRCNGQQDTELNAIQDERGTQEIRTRTTYNTTLATIEKIEYSGIIFCPTVSTGAFIARRNGQVFITGNSGFPKSLNIGKAVDKLQGNEREVVGDYIAPDGNSRIRGEVVNTYQHGLSVGVKDKITVGTSAFEGYGTALKPAHEPICMARKPLSEKSVAENCLKWGTGGINIDISRVSTYAYKDGGSNESIVPSHKLSELRGKLYTLLSSCVADKTDFPHFPNDGEYAPRWKELSDFLCGCQFCRDLYDGLLPLFQEGDQVSFQQLHDVQDDIFRLHKEPSNNHGVCIFRPSTEDVLSQLKSYSNDTKLDIQSQGRFPANLLHDNSEEVRECFPESNSGKGKASTYEKFGGQWGKGKQIRNEDYGDSGNASRFFKSIMTDSLCSLCCLPFDIKHDTMSVCKNTNVSSAEKSFKTTQATTESIALKNATGQVNKNLVQNVKSAGNLCDLCGTSIAQRLVAIMQDPSQESTLGELSIPEHKKQILDNVLASFVELRGKKDTTPTMNDLNLLFGFVFSAIENSTIYSDKENEVAKNHEWRSLLYQAKASKSERNKGCEGLEEKEATKFDGGDFSRGNGNNAKEQTHKNNHPTVKPIALMEYLIKMVTKAGGIVLDPFAGSGSTLVAAKQNGFKYIGIELTPEYIPIIEARLKSPISQKLF